jgi:hypothetical protein
VTMHLNTRKNIAIRDGSKNPRLRCAAYAGNLQAIKISWKKCAYKLARDVYGSKAHHFETVSRQITVLEEFLIDNRIEIDAEEIFCRTTLHLAALKEDTEALDTLLRDKRVQKPFDKTDMCLQG